MRNHLLMSATALVLLAACRAETPKRSVPDSGGVQQAAASTGPTSESAAGEARLAVDGGTVWYKVSGAKAGTPVILLHGGPGFSSYYLKPLEALGDERTVVRYDQLGGGKSSGLTDTTKINIAHFVRELDSLRAHLGFDRMHLVGHSWGTILGVEYYRAHPDRVASLTLASAALDIPQWERHARELLENLPDSMQRAVQIREAEKKFDAPDYQAALEAFYAKYVWLRPVKPDLDSMMKQVNTTVYGYMQGPSEFTITGTLKQYDATPFLKDLKVPTLFTVGAVDEADPATIRRHAAMVSGARVAVIPNAAHMTTWDNPEPMIAAIRAHLRRADSASAAH
jgi:proline-specific peptidase